MEQNEKKSTGALWIKESKAGNKFMSGVVEIDGKKHDIVVFKNNYKKESKHPDYRIFPSESREQKPSPSPQKSNDDMFDDDIPFDMPF